MATLGKPLDPQEIMRGIQPRNGFPVQNQGGLPQTPTSAPPKPFMTSPTVGAQPGPVGMPAAPGLTVPGVIRPTSPTVAPGPGQPPTGTVAAPPAATPAPAAAPAAGGSSSSSSGGSVSNAYAPLAAPAQDTLEKQIMGYLTPALSGQSVSQDFINRAKGDVFRNVQGQTKQTINGINEDAVRRGLFKSGIPAELAAGAQATGQSAMARGIADVLNSAENQNIQGAQQAGQTATSLLGGNRSWQSYWQDRQDQLQKEADARAGSNQPNTWDYTDPVTGQTVTLDQSWFF